MCGIVGYFSPEREIVDTASLLNATRLVRHRGPDDEGYALFHLRTGDCGIYSGSESEGQIRDLYPDLKQSPRLPHNIGMGFRRFSIIELTPSGHQPFWDRDRTVCLTFNGEIYNYLELRAELAAEGYTFDTHSDTEVLLASYLIWGSSCLNRLNGPLALAVYDTRRKSLILARDRIGKSPLYYTIADGVLYWASEIKSILRLAGQGSFTVNPQTVYDYIKYGWRDLDHGTFWSGIYSLPNASFVALDTNKAIDDRSVNKNLSGYWQIPSRRESSTSISLTEACDKFRDIFVDSVRIRLRADAKLALALSGGLDSSAIVAAAAGILRESVSTYTVKFREEYADEEPYARQVARMYGDRIDYHAWTPNNTDFWSNADAFVSLQEEPFHSPNLQTAQANYIRASEDGFRVMVTGAAGDEALAGYTEYTLPFFKYLLHQRSYLPLLRFLLSDSEGLSLYSRALRRRIVRVAGHFFGTGSAFQPLSESFLDEIEHREGPPKEFVPLMIENMGKWKMNYWLRSGNKAVFGIPVEPRSPFLDYRLIDFAFSLPPEYVMHNGWRKYILRRSMQDVLPANVVWRRRKMGFPFNNKEWLLNSEHIALKHLTAIHDNPFLEIAKIVPRYRALIDTDPLALWRCISFALWWRRVVQGEPL